MAATTYEGDLNRIKIVTDAAPATTAFAQIQRLMDSGFYAPIRGGVKIPRTSGQVATVYDYEFPTKSTPTYRVIWLTAGGATVSTVTLPTAPATPMAKAWIKHTLDPELNQAVDIAGYTPASYSMRAETYPILGSSKPVAALDKPAGKSYSLVVRTYSTEQTAAFEALLETSGVLYVQLPSWSPLPEFGYVAVTGIDLAVAGPWYKSQERVFELKVTQVAMPSPYLGSALS